MRTYITPVKLNKYNSNIPALCIKCMKEKGTLFHCLWQCSKVKAFWEEIQKAIGKIISKDLVINPVFFILGLYPKNPKYTKGEQVMIDTCLLHAKKSIALFWKKSSRPSITYWVKQMLITFPLEKITYIQKGKQELFEKVWGPFDRFVKGVELTDEEEV